YNLSSLVERVAPGKLVDEIIKVQHNCVSDSKVYASRVIRIAHEKLLVFKRHNADASVFFILTAHQRASNMIACTWRAAVRRVLQGKTLQLGNIYEAIEPFAVTRANNHWKAKVRQVLQDERFFDRVDTGVYKLAV